MADTAPTPRSARPWGAIALAGGVALVALLAWGAWRLAAEARGKARAAADAVAPPPPTMPENLLVSVPVPVAAPALDLPTAGGQRFSLSQARGQVVVINFWATWCVPCTQEIPSLVAAGRNLEALHPGKFRVVTVSVDEQPGAVARFFAAAPFDGLPPELVVALDPGGAAVSAAFHCKGRGACKPEDVRYPETYVVDRQGRIVAMVVGYLDWNTPGAMRFLEAVLAG